MANIIGDSGNNLLNTGTFGNDVYQGLAGNDTLVASPGNDLLDGGEDFDIADYSTLGSNPITLERAGSINKGSFGNDTIANIEQIIGSSNARNAIDGSTAASGTTSFDVNLDTEFITINGVPGLGSISFDIVNFFDVTGTPRSDNITGNSEDNIFTASNGDDLYNGQGGVDTVDYSSLNTGISIGSQGIIDKGSFGTDQIFNLETIIGNSNQTNIIDGSTAVSGTTSFQIDLEADSLVVKDVPSFPGDISFTVENFSEIIGTPRSDDLKGDDNNNTIEAAVGADTVRGSLGNDFLDGGTGLRDTVDYSDLGVRTDLLPTGVILKGEDGSLGEDDITGFEIIVGAEGEANTIQGSTSGSASINANLGAETLEVVIPGIGTLAREIVNFKNVNGTNNDDTITGDSQNNIFGGSEGDDTYVGGLGRDVIDYNNISFSEAYTLTPRGIIQKGSSGTDTVAGDVETIILPEGEKNLLDASDVGGTSAFIRVDLSQDSLNVRRTSVGNLNFTVENLVDVAGTPNNDRITGDSGNNTFFGSLGNDQINGGASNDPNPGVDTVDYSSLQVPVTLTPTGTILLGTVNRNVTRGSDGTQQAFRVDKFIAPEGLENTVNASNTADEGISIRVDLSLRNNQLQVNNVPGLGRLNFGLENFVNVTGTSGNDRIEGDNQDNILVGGAGNDQLRPNSGEDTLIGVDQNSSAPGSGERDQLFGGRGSDIFVLGNANDVFYSFDGNRDRAIINGFRSGEDQIVLNDSFDYVLTPSGNGGTISVVNNDESIDAIAQFRRGSFALSDIYTPGGTPFPAANVVA